MTPCLGSWSESGRQCRSQREPNSRRLLDSLTGRAYLTGMVLLRKRTRPGLGIIEPCLPSPAKAPPSGPGWLHEIKHDSFRILARRNGASVRLITRAGNDFSSRFPFIAMAVGSFRFAHV